MLEENFHALKNNQFIPFVQWFVLYSMQGLKRKQKHTYVQSTFTEMHYK